MLSTPSSHPEVAMLRQYVAGTLLPAEQQQVEAHTLDCAQCADLLEGFSITDAVTTDQAIATLRTRLQARVAQPELAPVPVGWAWPRMAAAVALLGLAAGGFWGWEHFKSEPDYAAQPTTTTVQRSTPPPAPAEEPIVATPAPATAPAVGTTVPAVRQPARPATRRPAPAKSKASSSIAATSIAAADLEVPPAAQAAEMAETKTVIVDTLANLAKSEDELAESKKMRADLAAAPDRTMSKQKSRMTAPTEPAGAGAPAAMPAAPTLLPAPVGGTIALREYLRRSATEFDPELNKLRMTGNVRVRVLVGTDGKISEVKVTRGLRQDYDAEAQRIVCDGPAWTPGIVGGRRAPVPVEVTVPF